MSSSTTNLCDLPPELVGLIAERTDIRSRCMLRKSSKDIRQIVDDSKQVCDKIDVYVDRAEQSIEFRIDDIPTFVYALEDDNCVIRSNYSSRDEYEAETTLNGEDYVEVAVNDLMTILKNPKLIIKKFVVHEFRKWKEETVPPFTAALHRKLCVLNHKLHVEYISLSLEEDDMLQILPFCQPNFLRTLCLSQPEFIRLTRIIKMEQWKQAEILHLFGIQPLKDVMHFKQVSMLDNFEINRNPSWKEFKSFMEKIVAEGEHSSKRFYGGGFFFMRELEEYTRNLEKVPGDEHDKTVLKTLKDGSQIVLLFTHSSVEIDKYVDGKSVFESQVGEWPRSGL